MRTLEECRVEVFCRMEKGIAERKRKRNAIISVCVPLILCAAVLSVSAVLRTKPKEEAVNIGKAYTFAEIIGADGKKVSISDAESINRITSLFNSVFEKERLEDESNSFMVDNAAVSNSNTYIISLILASGEIEYYPLKDNFLTSRQANKTVVLTESELNQLLELLNEVD